jgi:hypothetical protein
MSYRAISRSRGTVPSESRPDGLARGDVAFAILVSKPVTESLLGHAVAIRVVCVDEGSPTLGIRIQKFVGPTAFDLDVPGPRRTPEAPRPEREVTDRQSGSAQGNVAKRLGVR